MKKALRLMTVAFVAITMLTLTGCKKDDGGSKDYKTQIAGSWVESSATIDGQTRRGDEGMFYLFNANGTGDLEFCGIQGVNTFTWTIDGNTLTMKYANPEAQARAFVCTIEKMDDEYCVITGKCVPMVDGTYDNVRLTWKKSPYKHYNDQFGW